MSLDVLDRLAHSRSMRLLLAILAAVLLTGCNATAVSVLNTIDDDIIVRTGNAVYRIPAGRGAHMACIGQCGDYSPDARRLWILTAQCEEIAEAEIDHSKAPPMNGTFVVGSGPTVTFDPNDQADYEHSTAYWIPSDPCP
jgi:hypothetical protein